MKRLTLPLVLALVALASPVLAQQSDATPAKGQHHHHHKKPPQNGQ